VTPTTAEVLLERYRDSADRPFAAFQDGPRLTYGEAIGRAAALANELHARGLGRGHRVLLALDNEPAFLDAWFACALGGFVMVPLNTRLRGPLLEDAVARSRPSAAIAGAAHVDAVEPLTAGLALRALAGGEAPGWERHDALVAHPAEPAPAPVGPHDPLSLIFTSGTTGPAKGAVLSQAHCVARSGSYVRGLRIDESDTMFTCLPLFHNNAQMATVLVAVLARARTAVYRRFSVSRFWDWIAESGATRFTLIGRMANQLLATPPSPRERDHRMRSACIVPHPQGEDAFEERFGVRVVSQYYGCTETIPMPPDLDQPRRPGSCGRPSDGFECAVLDEDGGPVADGEVGELCVRPRRPEGVMSGYFDMPAETLHAFRGLWYHTGDAVRRDGDGFYHLVGRLKDFIRHKGENISATEVEAVVNRHPGVADSAAVGEPDEWGEEEVVVYVEAVDGTLELDALRRHCAEALPDFMVPARIAVVESLPRNALGRVEKFRLRQP
jgi:crotonobetaine/carnitine-CoA ligase